MYAAGLSEQNKQFYRVLGNNNLKFPDISWVRNSNFPKSDFTGLEKLEFI